MSGNEHTAADEVQALVDEATFRPRALGAVQTATHPEDKCRRCGRPNVVWWVDSPLWNFVMRGDDINAAERYGGIVCPTCFAVLAEQCGAATMWRLQPASVAVELTYVTPSGRVWDPDAGLWVDP